jgi:hypothetical protein
MLDHKSVLDLSFRPEDYVATLDGSSQILSRIKGTSRRALVASYMDGKMPGEPPQELLQHALIDEQRRALARLHPALMSGEYLPDCYAGEVEIARITIQSTLLDVTAVYAKRQGNVWHYRVVDEHDGNTLTDATCMSAQQPLSLGELLAFFLEGWDLFYVLSLNFSEAGYPPEPVSSFFEGASAYYPHFDAALAARVDDWLAQISSQAE